MAETRIHPSAVVDPAAQVGEGCEIGPFCVIGPEVGLGRGVVLKSHVVVAGETLIGDETVVFPFASLGEVPQDLKFRGERTRLEIGARNRIREYVTMNPGTEGGGGVTRIGDDGLFMAGSHVAHDCQIGNRVILVNNASVAGHCVLEDDVIVGGCRACTSSCASARRDDRGGDHGDGGCDPLRPGAGAARPSGRAEPGGAEAPRRSREEIHALRDMLAQLGQGSFRDTARHLAEAENGPMVREVLDFILGPSDRSFLAPHP